MYFVKAYQNGEQKIKKTQNRKGNMKATCKSINGLILSWAILSITGTGLAQTAITPATVKSLSSMSDSDLNTFLDSLNGLTQIDGNSISHYGTFYSLAHPNWPPIPANVNGVPVWQMSDSTSYLLDDLGTGSGMEMRAMDASSPLIPGNGDGGAFPSDPPDISNYAKFMDQYFAVVDTNDAAANDTNLYNACIGFGSDTNTSPLLQISEYEPGSVIIKASHFDYSSETRNFALIVCDRLDMPVYKSIDIYIPSNNVQNSGWLVQGSVPAWQVTDPMYIIVTNISTVYNAFFQAIPYNGPQITLTGYNPNDTVSNTITLQAAVTDLSGVTNEDISINIDGASGRYSIGPSNTLTFETKYNPDGIDNIYLSLNNQARVFDPTNPPDNAQTFFSGTGTIPLDFENPQFLAFASDWCPPEAGTNYIYYYLSTNQPIACTISSPDDGRVVATYSGNAPAGYVAIPWNMTEADGVTPYSNDTYVVSFTAFDPDSWVSTNSLD